MDILDKFLQKISYKFPKGYPDINNKQDLLLLETTLKEMDMPLLLEVTQEYDDRIKQILSVDTIPKCQAKVEIGKDFTLKGEDLVIWEQLFPALPLKKDGKTPTAGAGKGEIATYWAYQHNKSSIETSDGRGGQDPDLIIGGLGVEIKAYDTSAITLGKFAGDKTSVGLLNQVLGVLSLFSEEKIRANTGNFKGVDLLAGFKVIEGLLSSDELQTLPTTQPFYNKIKILYDNLGISENATAEEAVAALMRKFLWTKLSKKPNLDKPVGYILNVSFNGQGTYYKITEESIKVLPDSNIINGVEVKSSEIILKTKFLF